MVQVPGGVVMGVGPQTSPGGGLQFMEVGASAGVGVGVGVGVGAGNADTLADVEEERVGLGLRLGPRSSLRRWSNSASVSTNCSSDSGSGLGGGEYMNTRTMGRQGAAMVGAPCYLSGGHTCVRNIRFFGLVHPRLLRKQ